MRNDLAETFQSYNLILKCGTREIHCWRQLSYTRRMIGLGKNYGKKKKKEGHEAILPERGCSP